MYFSFTWNLLVPCDVNSMWMHRRQNYSSLWCVALEKLWRLMKSISRQEQAYWVSNKKAHTWSFQQSIDSCYAWSPETDLHPYNIEHVIVICGEGFWSRRLWNAVSASRGGRSWAALELWCSVCLNLELTALHFTSWDTQIHVIDMMKPCRKAVTRVHDIWNCGFERCRNCNNSIRSNHCCGLKSWCKQRII